MKDDLKKFKLILGLILLVVILAVCLIIMRGKIIEQEKNKNSALNNIETTNVQKNNNSTLNNIETTAEQINQINNESINSITTEETDENETNNSVDENNVNEELILKEVNSPNEYFTINQYLQEYWRNQNNAKLQKAGRLESGNNTNYCEIMISLLNDEYVKAKNITESNLNNLLQKTENFYVEKMYYSKYKKLTIYYCSGLATNYDDDSDVNTNYAMIVVWDKTEGTFSIIPYEYVLEDFADIEVGKEVKHQFIQNSKNLYNSNISTYKPNDFDIANLYLVLYQRYVDYDIEKAYNCLDEEYKNQKYQSLEKYKKTAIGTTVGAMSSCTVEEDGNTIIYHCAMANRGNITITEPKFLEFTIKFDE